MEFVSFEYRTMDVLNQQRFLWNMESLVDFRLPCAKRPESLGTFLAVAILRQKMDTFLENYRIFEGFQNNRANQTQQRVHSISGIKQCHNHFIISGCFMHSSIM